MYMNDGYRRDSEQFLLVQVHISNVVENELDHNCERFVCEFRPNIRTNTGEVQLMLWKGCVDPAVFSFRKLRKMNKIVR